MPKRKPRKPAYPLTMSVTSSITLKGQRYRYLVESVTVEPKHIAKDFWSQPWVTYLPSDTQRITIVGELIHPKRRRKHATV